MGSCCSYNKSCLTIKHCPPANLGIIPTQEITWAIEFEDNLYASRGINSYKESEAIKDQEDLNKALKISSRPVTQALKDTKTKSSSNKCTLVIANQILPTEHYGPGSSTNLNLSFCSISNPSFENCEFQESSSLNSSFYLISNLSKSPKMFANYIGRIIDSSSKKFVISSMLLEGNTTLIPKHYKKKTKGKLRMHIIGNSFEIKEEDEGIVNQIKGSDELFNEFGIYKTPDNTENCIKEKDCESLTQNAEINFDNETINLTRINDSNEYKSGKSCRNKMLGAAAYSSERKVIGLVAKIKKESLTLLSMMKIFEKVHAIKTLKEEISQKSAYTEPICNNEIFKPTIQSEIANWLHIKCPSFHYFNSDFSSSQISFYNKLNYSLYFKNTDLSTHEGAMHTVSPNGFLIIFKSPVWNIYKETIRLNNLIYNHVYHSSVWHKGKFYVISREKCKDVENLDIDFNWQEIKPFSYIVEGNSAVFSVNNSVYLMDGRDKNKLCNSGLGLPKDWEVLNWNRPREYEGMGLLNNNYSFLLFRGKGKSINSYNICEISFNGIGKSKGEMMETSFFSNQPFGVLSNKKHLFNNPSKILEVSKVFKLVSIDH